MTALKTILDVNTRSSNQIIRKAIVMIKHGYLEVLIPGKTSIQHESLPEHGIRLVFHKVWTVHDLRAAQLKLYVRIGQTEQITRSQIESLHDVHHDDHFGFGGQIRD